MRNRKAFFSLVGVAAFASTSLVLVGPTASAFPAPDPPKVTICHRTNSVKNPYVKITVAESAVDGIGNSDHLSEHLGPVFDSSQSYPPPHNGDQWGDIIPPFNENGPGNDRPNTSLTLNWPAGQAIFNNDCNPVDFGTVVVKKVVEGTGADAATGYKIAIRCDIEGDNTLTEDVVLTAGESSDSFKVQTGSSCNASEDPFGLNAAFVSWVSDGPVTIVTDAESVVTITNTFAVTPVTPGAAQVSPATVAAAAVQVAPRTTG